MLYRNNAYVNNDIELSVMFTSSGQFVDVFPQFVEIRDSNNSVIQTIDFSQIIHTSVGIYTYTVSGISSKGLYYDIFYYYPVLGADLQSVKNSFFVREYESNPYYNLPMVVLKGTVIDPTTLLPLSNVKVVIEKFAFPEENSGKLIGVTRNEIETDEYGFFAVPLIRGVKYAIFVPVCGYRKVFTLDTMNSEIDITELDSWLYPVSENPGESSDYLGTSSGIIRPSSTGYYSDFEDEINMPVFDWN